jgi:hypothetical protein
MPIRPFKTIPKDSVEWARFFQQTEVSPDPDSVGAEQLQDGSVTFSKIQPVQPNRIIGRATSPAGTAEELTVGGGLEIDSGSLRRSALTGDVSASAGSGTTTIASNAVTYAKMQDLTASDRLLGRQSPGAGDPEEIVCTAAGRALIDDANASAQRTTLGLGTAATQNTGTSGANVPLLNGTNTWSGASTLNASLSFGTSGYFIANASFGIRINNSADTVNLLVISDSGLTELRGNFKLTSVGNKFLIAEGSNASMGVATLVGGTVTVSNTLVTGNSRILLTGQNSSGTHGELTVSARSAGTSFTITSSSATDTRSVAWLIIEPS